jgi:hypothetical protein
MIPRVWWNWLWRLRSWVRIGAITLVAGFLAYFIAWSVLNALDQHNVVDKATLLSLAAAAIAGGLSLPTLAKPKVDLTSIGLTDVADQLARRVMDAEEEELNRLLGKDTRHIDVGFVFDPMPARNALGADHTGHLNETLAYYQHLSPRRLTIIGKPGSGKTVLALELLVKLLEERQERRKGGAVAVRFSVSRWDGTRSVEGWLADELVAVYRLPPPVARGLLAANLVIPVLDGLDEMDHEGQAPTRAAAIVAELNAWVQGTSAAPLILTCREEEYSRLSQHSHSGVAGRRLLDAATVRLTDLTSAQVVRYILERGSDPDRWQPVIDRLTGGVNDRLAAVLNTPWRLTLAMTVYGGFLHEGDLLARSPKELLEHTEDIDEHLLRDYVRAATASHPPARKIPYRSGQVERWLRELAVYLDRNARTDRSVGGRELSGTDIVLHQLWPIAGDRLPRRVDTVLAAVMSVPGFTWFAAYAFSHATFWRILFFPVLAGYIAALCRASSAYWIGPKPLDYRQLVTWRGLAQLAIAAGVGIIAAFLFTPWAGAAVGFGAWVAGGISITPMQGLVTTVIRVTTPRDPLRRDLGLSLASGMSAAPALGLAFSQYLGVVAGWTCGVGYACLVGLTVASAPWRRYLAMLLSTRGRLPWRLGWFLDWACEAGLLRVSGIAYQFRHHELQDWLAGHEPVPGS